MLKLIALSRHICYGCLVKMSPMNSQVTNFCTESSEDGASKTKDHLTVTSLQSRDPDTHDVAVTKMSMISPTVKHLVLSTSERPVPFSFKAGQWIDMHIPGVDTVGGFSITSSPMHLRRTGDIHLAVKNSESPPSMWVHTKCQVGISVSIRVGGDFFLPPLDQFTMPTRILFIAGGVGINPLSSMIMEIRDNITRSTIGAWKQLNVTLLFSAKTHEELIFREEFDAIKAPWFKPIYFLTSSDKGYSSSSSVKYGRIQIQDVLAVLQQDDRSKGPNTNKALNQCHVYLCGPPDMTNTLQHCLKDMGVENIFFEKWW
ncbi:oxidoreductase NAD-binding domain-containing protein 1 [Folsomia candida]|uniref:Oxidoreductase NAD-binding domain-containing protein 1 n=1 Tax=Folsomia candida TaxID=158441 RepID=A0A226EJU8_FOLCA|nr:oxidoreductase NAD-binding domain-containing protein 1 [Folsomia candida]OXA57560.1 Oxidoreductase NAD-binding domain-containing protein 1 [Folsomia candida]